MSQKFNPLSGNFDIVLDKAEEISYDNATSGLAATDVQAALDELDTADSGKADTDLSNLVPTAINEDLVFEPGISASVKTGDDVGGYTGDLIVESGNAGNDSGQITIRSGTGADTASGNVTLRSGNGLSSAVSGDVNITTGSSAGSDSGSVLIDTGTAAGTKGKIFLKGGSEGIANQVWVSTDTNGAGNWAPSPSNSVKNYLGYINNVNNNGNFELGTTAGWSLGTTGTLTNAIPTGTPTFGSGASGNLSLSVVSSGQLAGSYSGSYASSAATTAGDMLSSSAITIDKEDQAKVLTFKFAYEAVTNPSNGNFSGTSSNSFGVACYDVTNSSWLPVAGNFAMTQNSGVGIATGTMQTNANTASIRFVVYNANASAGAITLYVDDFSLGPQTAPIGPIVTDPVEYTPVFTGFGTVSGITAYSWRDGAMLKGRITFTSGTPTAVQAFISLGFDGASGNVTTASTYPAGGQVSGKWNVNSSATTFFSAGTMIAGPSGTTLAMGREGSTTNGTAAANADTIAINGSIVELNYEVQIAGWSSNVQMSNDTDTRVVAFSASAQSPSLVSGTGSNLRFTGTTTDNFAAYNSTSGGYTIPVTGWYHVALNVEATVTANNPNQVMYTTLKLGSTTKFTGMWACQATVAANTNMISSSGTFYANAGEIINPVFSWGTSGTPSLTAVVTGSSMSIHRLSGPAVVAASETVGALYTGAPPTGTLTNAFNTTTFATKVKDTHNAYASGTYTAPVSGSYDVSAQTAQLATYAINKVAITGIAVNGTTLYKGVLSAGGANDILRPSVSVKSIPLNAGDLVTIKCFNDATTPTFQNDATLNWFSITRVGN